MGRQKALGWRAVVMLRTRPDNEWVNEGLCREIDPDLWFVAHHLQQIEPMAICQDCPVQQRCLEYALETEPEYGVWGGLPTRLLEPVYRKYRRQTDSGRKETVRALIRKGHALVTETQQRRLSSWQREQERKRRHKEASHA